MDIVIRATIAFFFVYLLTRIVGRRELSSLEPFDLILLIILGDAVQQGLTQDDYSLTGAILVVSTIALLQVFTSWVAYRFPRSRPLLEGEPIIVIHNGELIQRNLDRERLTIDDIAEEARKQQIAQLSEVKIAVLETSGTISFIKE